MIQVEAAQSRPQARPAPSGSSRRLQMLVKQRERLEAQLRELESEILTTVGYKIIYKSTLTYSREGSSPETAVNPTIDVWFP
jgi:hypothetical protein